MYEQHFGLTRPMFHDGIPLDEAVFRTAGMERVASELRVALTRKDSVAILSGASGTGKTTLATESLKDISTRLAFSFISVSPLSSGELLEQLLSDFGFEPYKKSRVERLQLWRQFLSEMAATDTRVCLLVENAEKIETEVLQALHDLTAADVATSPGANVVLTTGVSPEELLSFPNMESFRQRVCLRTRIEPLNETETRDYLEFKCRYAGSELRRVFASDVPACLHRFSGGVLRIIDKLLESTLIAAAAAGVDQVTGTRITEIATKQFGLVQTARPLANMSADGSSVADASAVHQLLEFSSTHLDIFGPAPEDIPTLTDYVVLEDDDSPDRLAESVRTRVATH